MKKGGPREEPGALEERLREETASRTKLIVEPVRY